MNNRAASLKDLFRRLTERNGVTLRNSGILVPLRCQMVCQNLVHIENVDYTNETNGFTGPNNSFTEYILNGTTSVASRTASNPSNYAATSMSYLFRNLQNQVVNIATVFLGPSSVPPYSLYASPFSLPGNEYFSGHKNDPETGLHYNLARSYDGNVNRWPSPDSKTANIYDPQSLNKYAYVRNDPINQVDPDGRLASCPSGSFWDGIQCYYLSDPPPFSIGGEPTVPDPSFEPSLPSCSSLASQLNMMLGQYYVYNVILADAQRLGVNLSDLGPITPIMAMAGGQAIGGQPGAQGDQTELVLRTSNQAAYKAFFSSLCTGSPIDDSANTNCFTASGGGILHGLPPALGVMQYNFRQNTPTNSMQIVGAFNSKTCVYSIVIDIDPNNPNFNLPAHSWDFIKHRITGSDTNYSIVAQQLNINPFQGICESP